MNTINDSTVEMVKNYIMRQLKDKFNVDCYAVNLMLTNNYDETDYELHIEIQTRNRLMIQFEGIYNCNNLEGLLGFVDTHIESIKDLFRFSGRNFALQYSISDTNTTGVIGIAKSIQFYKKLSELHVLISMVNIPINNKEIIELVLKADVSQDPLEALEIIDQIKLLRGIDVLQSYFADSQKIQKVTFLNDVYFKLLKLNPYLNDWRVDCIIDRNMKIVDKALENKILMLDGLLSTVEV